jgi:hypothetical protein
MKQHRNLNQQGFPGLLRRHPTASVFTLWATLLLLGGVSTATLVHTDAEAKMPAPIAEPSEVALAQDSGVAIEGTSHPALPLLSFGAIAASCALGCLLLSKTARPAPYPVQYKEPQPQPAEPELSDAATQSPPVTVIPKQQNHPLDWDEPSLADSLDLRQRRPLSHWL